MFLHFLTEDIERNFFMKFVYLLAVAEKEENSDNIPIHAYSENPEKNEYEFEEFAPGFSMQIEELLMLRKFAAELGITWSPVSSYYQHNTYIDSALAGLFAQNSSQLLRTVEKLARTESVAQMLIAAEDENLNRVSQRSEILKLVLEALLKQANATAFAVEKKKVILMEATAMAYVDGNFSKYELELLEHFCHLCHLDKELIEDFKNITVDFFKIYAKSLELITE